MSRRKMRIYRDSSGLSQSPQNDNPFAILKSRK